MSVVRSYDLPDVTTTVTTDYTKIFGADPPSDSSEQAVTQIRRGQYSGARTKNYFALLKAGGHIPHQSYERFDFMETRPPGTYRGTYNNGSQSYTYSKPVPRKVDGIATTLTEYRVLLNSKMASVRIPLLQQQAYADVLPNLDVGTMGAELHKTVEMLVGLRTRAQKLISEALRGGFSTAKAAGRANLEWRYGWRILGYDIENVVELLDKSARGKIQTGKSGDSQTVQTVVTTHDDNYYVSYDKVNTITTKFSFGVRVSVDTGSFKGNWFASLPVTLWELVPFSFVADWFVSIGSIIQAMVVSLRSNTCYSSFGYQLEQTADMTVINSTVGIGANAKTPCSATGSARSMGVLRGRIPLSSLSFKPQLTNELDWRKVLDLLSIFLTRLH